AHEAHRRELREGGRGGPVMARRGDHDAAADEIRAALAIAEPAEYLSLRAYAATSLAEIERLAGRPDNERAALQEALVLAEGKGDVVTAGRARERLAELAPVG